MVQVNVEYWLMKLSALICLIKGLLQPPGAGSPEALLSQEIDNEEHI